MSTKKPIPTTENDPLLSEFDYLYDQRDNLKSELENCQIEKQLWSDRLANVLAKMHSRVSSGFRLSAVQSQLSSSKQIEESNRMVRNTAGEPMMASHGRIKRDWVKHRRYEANGFRKEISRLEQEAQLKTHEILAIEIKLQELRDGSVGKQDCLRPREAGQDDLEKSETRVNHDSRPISPDDSNISGEFSPQQEISSSISGGSIPRHQPMVPKLHSRFAPGTSPNSSLAPDSHVEKLVNQQESHPPTPERGTFTCRDNSRNNSSAYESKSHRDSGFIEPLIIAEGPPMSDAEIANHVYAHELLYPWPKHSHTMINFPRIVVKKGLNRQRDTGNTRNNPAVSRLLFDMEPSTGSFPSGYMPYGHGSKGGSRIYFKHRDGNEITSEIRRKVSSNKLSSLDSTAFFNRRGPRGPWPPFTMIPRASSFARVHHAFDKAPLEQSQTYIENQSGAKELVDERANAEQTRAGKLEASQFELNMRQATCENPKWKQDVDGEVKARFMTVKSRHRRLKLRRSYSFDASDLVEKLRRIEIRGGE